jgi:hypothetical protein
VEAGKTATVGWNPRDNTICFPGVSNCTDIIDANFTVTNEVSGAQTDEAPRCD